MDKVYDFSWIILEIDQSIILKLVSDNELIGVYQVSELGYDGEEARVKFANVADLEKFILHSSVVFRDVADSSNIIRIPIRKLLLLFSYSNKLDSDDIKSVNTNSLEAFMVCDGEILKGKYQILAHKVNDESNELMEIMKIAYKFGNMGMNDKIEALEKVNLINYYKDNEVKSA